MSNYNEFKPKLSKHDLILQRYKNLLNSPSFLQEDKQSESNLKSNAKIDILYQSVEVPINSKKIFLKTEDISSSPIINQTISKYEKLHNKSNKPNLNSMQYPLYTQNTANTNSLNFMTLTTDSNLSNIEKIKNKYHKRTETYQLHYPLKINIDYKTDYSNSSKNSKFTEIINDTLKARELEDIKKKYLNKSNEKEKITYKLNTIIEEKILQLKKDVHSDEYSKIKIYELDNSKQLEVNLSNKKLIQDFNNYSDTIINENGGSIEPDLRTSYQDINKNQEVNNSSFLNKILSIEEKLKEHLNEEIVENKLAIYSKSDLVNTIESKIRNFKKIKIEHKNSFISKKDSNKNSNTTEEVLNKLIYNVTGQLFDNLICKKISSNDTSLDFDTMKNNNKPKIFKLRANSAPKKKIMTFDEFIEKDK
jgi:hypothetical protein